MTSGALYRAINWMAWVILDERRCRPSAKELISVYGLLGNYCYDKLKGNSDVIKCNKHISTPRLALAFTSSCVETVTVDA
jgi:hypothetical protein